MVVKLNLGDIVQIVKEELCIDGKCDIAPDTRLADIGGEPMYVFNILETIIGPEKMRQYISGGSLNDNGKKRLDQCGLNYLAEAQTNNEFNNRITLQDLVIIQNYESEHLLEEVV